MSLAESLADIPAVDIPAPARGFDAPVALVLDFLQWLDAEPRTYAEALEAWRTSCPRLTVWEDALDGGYAARRLGTAHRPMVELTDAGRALLEAARRR